MTMASAWLNCLRKVTSYIKPLHVRRSSFEAFLLLTYITKSFCTFTSAEIVSQLGFDPNISATILFGLVLLSNSFPPLRNLFN